MVGPTGLQDGWTAGEARRDKRSRAGQEGGRKGMRELEGKAAGDERAFIPSTAPGWQMGRLRYPGTAGGEAVTGPLYPIP
jgi:hypothetical protein